MCVSDGCDNRNDGCGWNGTGGERRECDGCGGLRVCGKGSFTDGSEAEKKEEVQVRPNHLGPFLCCAWSTLRMVEVFPAA